MYVTLLPFVPDRSVWCALHKRYHPLGVVCAQCLEAIYDAAITNGDRDTSVGASHQNASLLTAGLELGALLVQVPVLPEFRRN